MNKKILFSIPLFILAFSMIGIDFVSAAVWSYTIEVLPTLYNAGYKWNSEAQTLDHSSGVFILVFFYDAAPWNGGINITQWDSEGNREATQVTPFTVDIYGDDRCMLKIVELNSTYAFFVATDTDDGDDFYLKGYSWNVVTYTLTLEDTLTLDTDHEVQTPSHINAIFYSGDPYFIFYTIGTTTAANERIKAIQYDVSLNTLSHAVNIAVDGNTGADWTIQPFVIQNPNTTSEIYFMCSHEPDATLPKFWKIDVSAGTGELLATGGNVNRTTIDPTQYYINSDIIINGTDTYLYWTWARPYVTGTTRSIRMMQYRLRFNVTVETAELEDQNERTVIISPTLGASSQECWAVPTTENRTDFTVYHPTLTAGELTGYYWALEVTDWFNFGITSMGYTSAGEDNETIPFVTEEDTLFRRGTSQFQLNVDDDPAPDEYYLFYGLTPVGSDYDLDLVYTPLDDPLNVNENYRWTLTTYRNDIQTNLYFILYIDGSQEWAYNSGSSGSVQFIWSTGQAGVHTFYVALYDAGSLVYGESVDYNFQAVSMSDTGDTAALTSITVGVMMGSLPLMFIFFAPMVICASIFKQVQMGVEGFMIGGIIGTIFGLQSGYLPPALAFAFIISLISFFVYRSSRA